MPFRSVQRKRSVNFFLAPTVGKSYTNMHVRIVLCCGVKMVNKLSECWCHIINSYLFTKFHTSKHLGKSYTNMHVHIVFCCGAKRVLFTKLSEC